MPCHGVADRLGRAGAASCRGATTAAARICPFRHGRLSRLPVLAAAKKTDEPPPAAKPTLAKPKAPSAAATAQAQKPGPPASPEVVQAAWAAALEAQKKGDTVQANVVGVTESGVIVSMRPLKGFISFKNLDPNTLKTATNAGGPTTLVGKSISAKVITVDPSRKELVLSERRVAASEALSRVAAGQTLRGVVTALEDYGAFVTIADMPDVVGLVHKTELSWDRVMTVDDVVQRGQEVQVKVLSVDAPTCRLALSLKQLTMDPLRVSIDDLSWSDSAGATTPEAQRLVEALAGAAGVTGVAVTREAQNTNHISQELEVYLTRSDAEGVFRAVARIGSTLTELSISTTLTREQIKQLLQRVVRTVTDQ